MKAKKIIIANQKGGVGKTTTTIELAATLSNYDRKVLVIDLDQQCNLTNYVSADREFPTIYNVLQSDTDIHDAIQHLNEFDVITAAQALSKADKEFGEQGDMFLLDAALDEILDDYDYIFIDNSPSRGQLLNMAYFTADFIIIPTECDTGSQDGIVAIFNDIERLKKGKVPLSHAVVMGIILNKYEKTQMHEIAYESICDLAETLGQGSFVIKVRKSIRASEAKLVLKSMQSHARSSTSAIDFREVADEIISREE